MKEKELSKILYMLISRYGKNKGIKLFEKIIHSIKA